MTGMSSTPKAGNITCHWLTTDTAQIHYSLGNTLKIKSLVQLDGLEIVQHVCIFGRDLYRLIFNFFLLLCLKLQHQVLDAVWFDGVHHVQEIGPLWHPTAFEVGEILVNVVHFLHLLPNPFGRDCSVLLDSMDELDLTQI